MRKIGLLAFSALVMFIVLGLIVKIALGAPLFQVPANDAFANASVIGVLPYNTTQNTAAATTQAQDPVYSCITNSATTNNGRGWHSVWYAYTATAAGTLHVDTVGSNYDTVVGVWQGAFGTLTNVGCDDDTGGNYTSSLNAAIASGTTYYIEVAGYYSYSSGNLVISVDSTTGSAPPNDDFDNAFIISSAPYTYTQNTATATTAFDDPTFQICATGNTHSHSVWYSFTAPSNGDLHVDTSGSGYDTVLAVWTGMRGALTAVACHDDVTWPSNSTSSIDTSATAGTTYYIEVVSYGSGAGGSLAFHANFAVLKPVYLHRLASSVTIITGITITQIMDRRMVWGGDATVTFSSSPASYFYLYPRLAETVSLCSTISGILFLRASNNNTDVTVNLVDLSPDGSTTTIGSDTLTVGTTLASYAFSIASGNYQLLSGHSLRLGLATTASNRTATLTYDSAIHNSRVEMLTQSYVNIAWVGTYDGAYPAGAQRSTFVVGAPVYIRANASDPFGSYDVTTATLAISGANLVMNSAYDSGADYEIFESIYTPTLGGVYPYTVTINEGSEGTVRDTERGQFYASAYGVYFFPDATLYTAPNTSVDYGLTLRNTGSTSDTFELALNASTQSWATELYLGAVLIASDSDGDGLWNFVNPAYDSNGDGAPDLQLPAGGIQTLILRKIVSPATGEVVDTTILVATSRGDSRTSDAVILTTSTATGVQNKQLHLLGSGTVYTLSTRSGSANATITLGQGISRTWAQSPAFASAFDLRQGALSIYFYAVVPGSSPTARVTVYHGTTSIGAVTQTIASTGWQTFTLVNPNVVIPVGGVLTVGISNTTTTSRSFTVQYNGAGNYDAYLDMPTKTYVNEDQIQTRSVCVPGGSLAFNQGQTMTITTRVSDPFGGYDIAGASVRGADPGGVAVIPGLAMSPVLTITGAITYERSYVIPVTATLGNYNVVITGTESNGVTATNTALFVVQRPAILTASLSGNPNPVNVGEPITVTMRVTNTGQANALAVSPSALTPAGIGSVILAFGPSPTSVVRLSAGGLVTFTWRYTATSPGNVNWTGAISGSDAAICAIVSTGAVTTTPPVSITAPVLALSKSVIAPIGSPVFTYTVRFTNTGSGAAYPIRITDTLPVGVIWGGVVSTSPPFTLIGTTPPIWTTPILTAGGAGSIVFTVSVPVSIAAGTILTNGVAMSSRQTPVMTASVTTTVISPVVMTINKTDRPDPVMMGNTLVYTLSYVNTGSVAATGVVITETYPNVTYQSANPLPSVSPNLWNLGSVGAGAAGTIVITVTPNAVGVLTNVVAIDSDQTPPVTASITTTAIPRPPAFVLTKSGAPDLVLIGSNLTYNVNYQNVGGDATGVVITEIYDPNVSFVSADPAPTSGNNVWSIGALNAGGSGTMVVTVHVNGGTTLVNQVTMTSAQGVSASATAINTTVLTGQVTINKIVTPTTFPGEGKQVTYTILITNSGAGVPIDQITDTLPAGFTYITTTSSTNIPMPNYQPALGDQMLTWSYDARPSIPPTATLTFVAKTGADPDCNYAGVTIGSIVIVSGPVACFGWPEYLITAQAGSQTIRARVRLTAGGWPTILSWEFLP